MLTEKAAAIISAMVYDPNAEPQHSLIPLGSIYWPDELPGIQFVVMKDQDRNRSGRLLRD